MIGILLKIWKFKNGRFPPVIVQRTGTIQRILCSEAWYFWIKEDPSKKLLFFLQQYPIIVKFKVVLAGVFEFSNPNYGLRTFHCRLF